MDSDGRMTQNYKKIIKKFKSLSMLGELTTLILRILVQRIFSVYIGIVLVQFIVTTQMNFKTYCVIESRFYIIMNFILIYLLTINFIENSATQWEVIQSILKDKYVIDYTKIGYPLQFLFRIVSTFLTWRLYQFSKLKTFEYGDVLPNQQLQTSERRHDRIHVRENQRNQGFNWRLSSNRNDNETSRNLPHSDRFIQSISSPPQLRQRNSQQNQQYQIPQNSSNRAGFFVQQHINTGIPGHFNQIGNRNVLQARRNIQGTERISHFSNNLSQNRPNVHPQRYMNLSIQRSQGNMAFSNNTAFRR